MQTNAYAQRLAELQQQPDHELKQIGDQWQTPPDLAMGLFWHFTPKIGPVVLDLFADECNALCPEFYSSSDNALTQEWANDLRQLGGAAFANPPYSRPQSDSDGTPITGIENILAYCREQRELGAKIMLLIKAGTSEGWWPEDADFIQFISGRIGFKTPSWYVPRDPKKDKPSSSGFASAVVIFDKDWKWDRRPVERLNRNDLETQGRMIMNMIESRATVIAESMLPVVAEIEPSVITEQAPIEESDCQLADVADDNYQLDLDASTDEPTAKGKDLPATEFEPVSEQLEEIIQAESDATDDDSFQLPLVAEQEEDFSDKTLDEIEAATPEKEWPRLLCELIAIFGVQEKYSHRELMFVMTSLETKGVQCGTEEKHALATYIDGCVRTTKNSLPLGRSELITAVAAGFHFITKMNGERKLFRIVQVMRNAAIGEEKARPCVDLSDTSDVPSLSAEWLREQYIKLDGFAELMDSLKQEAIDKTIDAVGYINEEFANNALAPKAEDVIDAFFASNPNCRTYLNSRSLRAEFRSLVQASIKEVANG